MGAWATGDRPSGACDQAKRLLEKLTDQCIPHLYPMPEISDFQRTNSEFAKSEQKYPVKITLA
jgi:hypothetical protein